MEGKDKMKKIINIIDYCIIKSKIKRFGRSSHHFLKYRLLQKFYCIPAYINVDNTKLKETYESLLNSRDIALKDNDSDINLLKALVSNIQNQLEDCPKELYGSEFWYLDTNWFYQFSPEFLINNIEEIYRYFSKKDKIILVIDNYQIYANDPDCDLFKYDREEANYFLYNDSYCMERLIREMKKVGTKIITISKERRSINIYR